MVPQARNRALVAVLTLTLALSLTSFAQDPAVTPGARKPEAGKAQLAPSQDPSQEKGPSSKTSVRQWTAPPTSLARPDPDLDGDCAELFGRIETLDRKIPKSFQYLPRPIEEIARDIAECAQLCRRFVDECPGKTAEVYVQRLLARMLLASVQQYGKELKDQGLDPERIRALILQRFDEARVLGTSALEACEPNTAEHLLALLLLIDLASQAGGPPEIRGYVESLAETYGAYPALGEQLFKVGKSYVRAEDYDAAVAYSRKIISEHRDDSWYPIFNINLFDGLQGIGDLHGMKALMLKIRAEYPALIPKLTGIPASQAAQWLDVAGFWLGFSSYALGEIDQARQFFSDNETHLSAKIAELEAKRRPVDPVIKVYLNYRTKDYLKFLREYHGQTPAVDLDLGPLWATSNKITLRESRGKVLFVLFREPGNQRSLSFYRGMDTFAKEREKDGLVGATVSHLLGKQSDEVDRKAIDKMLLEMAELGISLPGGYDPDRKSQSLFHGMHATVGPSASFVVFNRRGEFAWYLFDPRPMDQALARTVLDRILKE